MSQKRKRFFYLTLLKLPLAITALSATFLFSSLPNSSLPPIKASQLSESVKKRSWLIDYNSKPSNPWAYYLDDSDNYGSVEGLNSVGLLTHLNFFRYQAFGKPEIKTEVKFENGQVVPVNTIVKPAYQALRFFAANKVFITGFDGKIRVFDSDDFEIPKETPEGGEAPILTLSSKNPHSINSQDFKKALLGAKKISLGFRDDVFWVTQKGKKTDYKLIARDFLFSYLRTFFRTQEFRYKYGGSEQLDNLWYQKTNASKFLATSEWPNEYLLQLFNIDSRALLDLDGKTKKKPLEKIRYKGRVYDVLSFNVKEAPESKEDASIQIFFFKNLVGSTLFIPAPSAFILEEAKKRGEDIGSGLIRRIGFYWYGEKPEDNLFAGAYLPLDIIRDNFQQVITFRKNPYYFDQEFVHNKDTIKEVVVSQSKREAGSFQQARYADFVQGRSSAINPSDLGDEVFRNILSGRDSKIPREAVQYRMPFNIQSIGWHVYLSFPSAILDAEGKPNPEAYLFNDVFAKFMYGASLEELAKGEAKIAKRFFSDEAISFRSILIGAINWDKVYNQISNGNSLYSLTLSPPNGRFQGSDRDSSKYQTPIDAKEFINDAFIVKDGKRVLTIKHSDNLDNLNNLKESESFLGGGAENFAKLQDLMTDLLDKFYQENNFSDSEKMDIPWALFTTSRIERYDLTAIEVLKTLNSLDKKARLNFNYVTFKDNSEAYDFFYKGKSPLSAKGWSNDYEGNGSTLTAFLQIEPFNVVFLPIFASRSETDPDNPFPLLTRLSKLFIEGVERGRYRFKIPVKEWADLTNKDLFDGYNTFRDLELPNPDTEIARFLYQAQDKFSNEEHARLNVELAILIGPKFNHEASVANNQRGIAGIYQKGFINPRVLSGIYYFTDVVYNPIEEDKDILNIDK